jgi:NADPH:quinone reductase-like Zn-dependent oxidoreductase
VAGVIEATGKAVTKFKTGDEVFAWTALRLGGNAEYACLSETATMAIKPASITYKEAAAVPLGGLEAWQYLNGRVQTGHEVLIIGAGGTIGTFAVQLAKHFGADVTAVDRTEKLDMLRSIGAHRVIDYTREDFTKTGQRFDLIFDAPGKSSFSRCAGLLKPDGLYLSANPGLSEQIRSIWFVVRGRKRAVGEYTGRRTDDLMALGALLETGEVKSVVDRCYPLEETADAHRYVETGLKRGNVVITVKHETEHDLDLMP